KISKSWMIYYKSTGGDIGQFFLNQTIHFGKLSNETFVVGLICFLVIRINLHQSFQHIRCHYFYSTRRCPDMRISIPMIVDMIMLVCISSIVVMSSIVIMFVIVFIRMTVIVICMF